MTEVRIPTTSIIGVIVSVSGIIYGIAYQGQIFEATDNTGVGPAVGNVVLADYLPSSGQWIVVAIIT